MVVFDVTELDLVSFFLESESSGEDVANDTTAVDGNGGGAFVLAEAISWAGIVAAPGPVPMAGTLPICFEVIATGSSTSFEEDDGSTGKVEVAVETAGGAVDKASGGSVFADAISFPSIFAAPGPLPTAGTEPICFAVEARVASGKEIVGGLVET